MQNVNNTAYILLGGNLLDVKQTFEMAIDKISQGTGMVTAKSALYKSAAWGFVSDNPFLNQVIEINTKLSAPNLLTHLLKIEQHLGRVRNPGSNGFSSRIIDIDILYYNAEIYNLENLIIPHYAIKDRMFTLLPLCDLIPNFVHPIIRKTNTQLMHECDDKNIPIQL